MNAEQIVGTLASQLDDDGLVALDTLIKHASTSAAQEALTHSASRDGNIQKLAHDLAQAGFEPHEVVTYLDKLAEQQKTAQECNAILDDCTSMGTWIGKQAGDVASQIILRTLENYVAKHAEEETPAEEAKEEKEEAKEEAKELPPQFTKKEEGSEEEEEEEEKEASARVAKLAQILAPVLLRNG